MQYFIIKQVSIVGCWADSETEALEYANLRLADWLALESSTVVKTLPPTDTFCWGMPGSW